MNSGDPHPHWVELFKDLSLPVTIAIAARFIGIGFGLPYLSARPDEETVMQVALRFFSGDLNPHFFHYGTQLPYLTAILAGGYFAVRMVTGVELASVVEGIALDPSPIYLAGRGLSAFAGVATIIPTYYLGRRLGGRRMGVIAAWLLALCYPHVRESHFLTVDVLQGLWLMAAIERLTAALGGERRALWHSAIFSGLACSVKYAGLLLAPGLALVSVGLLPWTPTLRTSERVRRTLLVMGSFLGAFLLFTPFAVLDFSAFWRDLSFELFQHRVAAHQGIDLGVGWVYHIRHTLPHGLGYPWLLAAATGLVLVVLRRDIRWIPTLLFVALYGYAIGSAETVFVRYALPMYAPLSLMAALALSWGYDRLRAGGPRLAAAARVAVISLVLWHPVKNTVLLDMLLSRDDSRALVGAWLTEHVPDPGSFFYTGGLAPPPGVRLNQVALDSIARAAVAAGGGARANAVADFFRRTDPSGGWSMVRDPLSPGGIRPQWLITQASPLIFDDYPTAIDSLIEADYELVETIEGAGSGQDGWYDRQDAFYLPFDGLEGVARPGPEIRIYRRRDGP